MKQHKIKRYNTYACNDYTPSQKARIQDYGETSKLIVNSIRYLLKVKDKLGVHVVLTGHEGLNSEDKDENGNIINPRISIEVQAAIHNNLVTQFDIIGHTFIEDHTDEDGNSTHDYVFRLNHLIYIQRKSDTIQK